VCGLYDVAPAKFGQVNSAVTRTSNFGRQVQFNDFFNVNINARLNSGLQVGGGVDTGRTVNDVCFNVDSPAQPPTSRVSLPLRSRLPARPSNGQLICRIVTPFKVRRS